MRRKTRVAVTAAAACTAYLCALAPASQAATVCNEAENSPQGGYVVSAGIVDPSPPAFLRGSQMSVGTATAAGLGIAADQSPALRQCTVPDGGGSGGDT